jgi:hypothetical protein
VFVAGVLLLGRPLFARLWALLPLYGFLALTVCLVFVWPWLLAVPDPVWAAAAGLPLGAAAAAAVWAACGVHVAALLVGGGHWAARPVLGTSLTSLTVPPAAAWLARFAPILLLGANAAGLATAMQKPGSVISLMCVRKTNSPCLRLVCGFASHAQPPVCLVLCAPARSPILHLACVTPCRSGCRLRVRPSRSP